MENFAENGFDAVHGNRPHRKSEQIQRLYVNDGNSEPKFKSKHLVFECDGNNEPQVKESVDDQPFQRLVGQDIPEWLSDPASNDRNLNRCPFRPKFNFGKFNTPNFSSVGIRNFPEPARMDRLRCDMQKLANRFNNF